jgi:hypothetical protein
MNAPQLCLHTGETDRVTRDTLRALPLPQPLSRRHRPVPHIALVEALQDQLDRRGLAITREQLALRRDGQRLFGTMDLAWQGQEAAAADEGLALGLRQGNDLSYAIEVVAGQRIFVCDNLAFYGEVIAVRRKHTSGLRLGEEVSVGIDRYLEYVGRLVDAIATLKQREIGNDEAKRAIYDVFAQRILPLRFFDDVDRAYFRPEADWTDCHPRTLWAVHNACTRAVRELPMNLKLQATTRLGRLFGLGRTREQTENLDLTTSVN